MSFDEKASGNKSTRDKSLIRLLKSPAIMASGVSTIFLPEKPVELGDKSKLLLQEKHVGINSNLKNEEIVAVSDKVFE